METAEGLTRRPPRPLNAATNGHTHGSEQLSASEYPSPPTSDEEDDESEKDAKSVSRGRRGKRRQRRLRFFSPQELIDEIERKTERRLFSYLLLFRGIVGVVTSYTVFAPDEHWQSLEIAHKIVFGYGYTTWEWRDPRMRISDGVSSTAWGSGPIRSPLYPLIFTIPYWLLKISKLDQTLLLTILPSMLQSVMAALTDLYTFKLARKLLNDRSAWITLIPTLLSAYIFHTSTRTLSNSAEAALTILAFYYWPLSLPQDSDHDLVGNLPLIKARNLEISLAFFAFASMLRPSNVLLSIPLLFQLMLRILANITSAATALESAFALILVGRACLTVSIVSMSMLTAVDSIYYGRLTSTPVAFFRRNVMQGISVFYGSSPLHFYLTSAVPSICFTLLPYALYGTFMALQKPKLEGFDRNSRRWYGTRGERDPIGLRVMTQVIVIFIACMSILEHKETRFLQPIVPLITILEGYALSLLPSFQAIWSKIIGSRGASRINVENEEIWRRSKEEREGRQDLFDSLLTHHSTRNRRHILRAPSQITSSKVLSNLKRACHDIAKHHGILAITLLALQIPPIIYLSFHSAGQIAIVKEVGRLSRDGQLDSVAFLMPCHSTPWMSHLHDERLSHNNNAWFISCEPPLHGQNIATYMDESDYFYQDPYRYIQDLLASTKKPSHLALFEALLDQQSKQKYPETVADLLSLNGYSIKRSYWNSAFHLDHRRRGRVLLMQQGEGD